MTNTRHHFYVLISAGIIAYTQLHITEHLSEINAKGKLNIDTSMMEMYKYNRNIIIERTVSLKILRLSF